MADTRLRDRVKGVPLVLAVRNDSPAKVDFTTDPLYLFLEREDGFTILLTYVPGGPANDGTLSVVEGVQRVTFRKDAAWTTGGAFPVGMYSVWPWVGDLDADDPLVPSERAGLFRVKMTEANRPLGVVP